MAGAGSFCQFHGAENKCYAWPGNRKKGSKWGFGDGPHSPEENLVSTPAEERGSRTGKLTEALSPCTSPPQVINSQPQLGETSGLLSLIQRRDVGAREGR